MLGIMILMCFILRVRVVKVVSAATWCVARSDANEQALLTALNYACGAGADCAPIQPSGLCFFPNTLLGHASYAFNSYYQRKAMAPGSCNFAATATIATTDPSYGSCVYPSSTSTAGGMISPGGTTTTPSYTTPTRSAPPTLPGGTTTPPLYNYPGGLTPPDMLPNSLASKISQSEFLIITTLFPVFLLVFFNIFQTM